MTVVLNGEQVYPVPCRRHAWGPAKGEGRMHALINDLDGVVCVRCGKPRDAIASRRGRTNRARGNAIELQMARRLGLRRVGQYGTEVDAEGDWLIAQVKSGVVFPEKLFRWLNAMSAKPGQTRVLVLADAPGAGHRRRALVVLSLDEWELLHGVAE